MRTIVLFGVKGSGKDTVGAVLRDRYSYWKESFAWPIKQMVKLAFPKFTDEDLYGSSEARERQEPAYPMGDRCVRCNTRLVRTMGDTGELLLCGQYSTCGAVYPPFLSARVALQAMGTELGRRLYSDVWVDGCFERISRDAMTNPHYGTRGVVVTDGRFRNELVRSKALGAFCVKLTRGLKESTSTHQSEAEFRTIPDTAFDAIFDNANMTLGDLPDAVSNLLNRVGMPR